jgi:hypothetical protein
MSNPYTAPSAKVDEPPEPGELAITFGRTAAVAWSLLWRVLLMQTVAGVVIAVGGGWMLRLAGLSGGSTISGIVVDILVLLSIPLIWFWAVRSILNKYWFDFRLAMVPMNWAYPARSTIRDITIENASATSLSNLILVGFGFGVKAGDLSPGQRKALRVRLRGDSPLGLDYYAGDKHVRRSDVAYLREDERQALSIRVTDTAIAAEAAEVAVGKANAGEPAQ